MENPFDDNYFMKKAMQEAEMAFENGEVATSGTVMLAALPIIIGIQLLIAFMAYDIQAVPKKPIHLAQLKLNTVSK